MRAGKLDRTIILQRRTEHISPAGTVTSTWTDFAVLRAELVSNGITEGGQPYGEADTAALVFRIRYYHGLTTKDRLIYRGNPYDLTGIVELGRNRALELRCEAST
ncbi:phage head closure protein [Devosia sp. RR2S18]|uniref:phage head closure protein n=1 Tax=Devosia rhizosphaerae TaxID=3049774 RepID=UPI002541AF17|nr:phage head closure protein [Devosia sp. RR2S18]WIJ24228.1 phage head closure protein [Devosia sp. RR2S18]